MGTAITEITNGTLMTDAELERFQADAAEFKRLNRRAAEARGYPDFRLIESARGTRIEPRLSYGAEVPDCLRGVNKMLGLGMASAQFNEQGQLEVWAVRADPNAAPPVRVPMAWMDERETAEFDAALETIRAGRATGECAFDSGRDANRNLYTMSSVKDGLDPERSRELHSAMSLVTQRLHDGSAVSIEMPSGNVMHMARWPVAGK